MLKKKVNKTFLGLLILPIILTGCISIGGRGDDGNLGGFFLTENGGDTWGHRVSIYTTNGEIMTFNNNNITAMAFDPQDQAAVYLGTQTAGIFYTYNYGQGWLNSLANKGAVNEIIVHPENKCVIYAAVHNDIWKTEDCSRTWDSIYFEDRESQFITALNISYEEPNIVYAGTSGGSFLRSVDNGNFWDVLHRFDDDIKNIIIQNHSNSSIIYVITKTKGVFRSQDKGVTWEDLMQLDVFEADVSTGSRESFTTIQLQDESKPFYKISGVKIAIAADSDRSVSDGLIYTNRIGMFRLVDNHWEQIKLLTPKKKDTIYSVAINPLDGQEIFYGTDTALYHSIDGGVNWEIKELPTTRAAGILKFSPNNKLLYLGAYKIKQ